MLGYNLTEAVSQTGSPTHGETNYSDVERVQLCKRVAPDNEADVQFEVRSYIYHLGQTRIKHYAHCIKRFQI